MSSWKLPIWIAIIATTVSAALAWLMFNVIYWGVPLLIAFLLCGPPRDHDRGQCLVKMANDPIRFSDPDIVDVKFDLRKWQSDHVGKVRQSMVRDLVCNHKELFMNKPSSEVKKILGDDAALWWWAHPTKNDFGCVMAQEGLKYQNCIQFNVRNGRVTGYVANVVKVF
ncbi:MAG TPA: hypothetical protein V6C97_24900 [Oculatellaceae cyanobacterium]